MKLTIALFIAALPLFGQTTDADAVTAKAAVDSLATHLGDQIAANKKQADTIQALQAQTSSLLSQLVKLQAQLAALPPPDPAISWLKSWNDVNGDAQPYTLLRLMSAFPITSYYSPGTSTIDGTDRITLACISNSPVRPIVGPVAGPAVTAK